MDISIPKMSGIEELRKNKKIDSNAKIIKVSTIGYEIFVREVIIGGAKGVIVNYFKEEYLAKILRGI